jgi:hypothetical protein
MKPAWLLWAGAGAALACGSVARGAAFTHRGFVAAEYNYLPLHESNPLQAQREWGGKLQWESSFKLSDVVRGEARLFAREDASNDDRDVARVDELWLQYARYAWDVRLGNQLITWGSVESFSPLDVINPRDYEDDVIEPVRMGIPALQVRRKLNGDDLSLYWLPYFEPTAIPGARSYYSVSGGLPLDEPDSRWAADQWAARYFHAGDGFDAAVSWIHALERNPVYELAPALDRLIGRSFASNRYGLELTRPVGDGVLKTEVVHRTTGEPGIRASWQYVLGGEYTWVSAWRLSDLTLFVEYLGSSGNLQDRELLADDVFIATRWTLNDIHKQQFQGGLFVDREREQSHVFRLEYRFSPNDRLDLVTRYTQDRAYFSLPQRQKSTEGVFYVLARFNF